MKLKNIAVLPDCQRKGYGKSLIEFLFSNYAHCRTMFVGTGDVPSALTFYNKCGFTESHRIKNFFVDNYDHPMFEDGKQLIDMAYLDRYAVIGRVWGHLLCRCDPGGSVADAVYRQRRGFSPCGGHM